jgi:hypothetical protein
MASTRRKAQRLILFLLYVTYFVSSQSIVLTLSVSGDGIQVKDRDGDEVDGYDEGKNM